MKKVATLSLLLLLGITASAQKTTEILYLSLEEAESYALQHNVNLRNAKLDIDAAEAFVKENVASGLPQVTAGVDVSSNFSLPPSFLPAEIVGGTPGETVVVKFGTDYSGQASATLTQMVFDGVFFVGLEAAKTFKERTQKEAVLSEIDVIESVDKAYYAALVSELNLELVEKNYGRLDTLLMETKTMAESGFAEKIDVNRVQLQFNNIEVQRKNARRSLDISLALLKFQMGMPVDQAIELTDKLEAELFEDLPSAGEFNYVDRVEYSILQSNYQLAELNKKLNAMRYVPSIELYATVGASAGVGSAANIFNLTNQWFGYGLAGVRLSIPIFDGLQKHRVSQQRKIEIDQALNGFEQLENSINLELKQTAIELENSIDFMRVQRSNMDLSEEVYNVTKTKYQQGVGSNIEVINADADYKQAQLNFFRALYEALVAKVNYEKALGKLLN